jgi:autotransporter passenger strand-loop-strand repeat protein
MTAYDPTTTINITVFEPSTYSITLPYNFFSSDPNKIITSVQYQTSDGAPTAPGTAYGGPYGSNILDYGTIYGTDQTAKSVTLDIHNDANDESQDDGFQFTYAVNYTYFGASRQKSWIWNVTINETGIAVVSAGQSVFSVVLNTGNTLNVLFGGTATDTIVNNGGIESVYGTDVGAMINDGGHQFINAGGIASGTIIYDPGVQAVSSGGVAIGATLSGGEQDVYGTASGTVIDSGGIQNVYSGGTVSNTTFSGGTQNVLSGAIVNGAIVGSGTQTVSSGGTASSTVLDGGAQQIVSSGGIAVGTTISSGDAETVLAGGSASATTISSGGNLFVSSGGTAINATVDSGGFEVVSSGASAVNTVINGGTEVLSAGAIVSSGIVFGSGGTLQIGGTTMPTTAIGGFASGDSIDLAGIGFASGGSATLLSGNVLQINENGQTYDLNFDSTQNFAGEQFTLSSDGASGTNVSLSLQPQTTTVSSGQTLNVSAGQTSNGIIVLSGGTLNVLSGGTASGTVDSGGSDNVSSGGTAIGTTVSGGGIEGVYGIASGTVIDSGGTQNVYSGGTVSNATFSGGTQNVLSGAIVNGAVIGSGTQNVSSGGTASTTVLDGGAQQIVSSGGIAVGTTISSGDAETVLAGGTASATTISGGGNLFISSGGTAISATVGSGGFEVVSSGASAVSTLINGGTEILSAGAIVNSGILFGSGGTLQIGGTAMPTNPISGFAIGDTIDLTGVSFGSGGSVTLLSGNVLQISENGHTYDLKMDPTQNLAGDYFYLTSAGSSPVAGTAIGLAKLPSVIYTTLDVPLATYTSAEGINDNGQIVGNSSLGAFLYSHGSYTSVQTNLPSGGIEIFNTAEGINNAGKIVGFGAFSFILPPPPPPPPPGPFNQPTNGTEGGSPSPPEGYVSDGLSSTPVVFPISSNNDAVYGINDLGQVVASYKNPNANNAGFYGDYTHSFQHPSGFGGYDATWARGINDNGQIVGYYSGLPGDHGFEYDINGGSYVTLDDPLGIYGTFATGINNLSQIVGYYIDVNLVSHGFLFSGGKYTTIDDPLSAASTWVYGINDGGQIVGSYVDFSGNKHGFLASRPSFVSSGQTVSGVAIPNGAQQEVLTGGTAIGTTLSGRQIVDLGATATFTQIDQGGDQEVFGTATGTVVNGGGTQNVYSASTVSTTTVNTGGLQKVYSGGSASGTTVNSGGTLELFGGATLNGNTISSGGILEIGSNFTLNGYVVSSGVTLAVASGGAASRTLIRSGGAENIFSGGQATGEAISDGGHQTVNSGGTAIDTVVDGTAVIKGGSLELTNGSSTGAGVIAFEGPGGTLQIDGTFMPTNPISGLAPGDVFDLAAVHFDSAGTATLLSGNVLQIIENGQTEELNLDSSQNFVGEQFSVLSDGTGGTNIALTSSGVPGPLTLTINGGQLIGASIVNAVPVTIGGLQADQNGGITFSDGNSLHNLVVTIVNGVPFATTANLSGLVDGPIAASISVTDISNHSFGVSTIATLDRDADEQVMLSLAVNGGLPIGAAIAGAVPFTVGGPETDDNGTVSFSDGVHAAVVVDIVDGVPSAPATNLAGLNDGAITATLRLINDSAGNSFMDVVTGATLDQDTVTSGSVSSGGVVSSGDTLEILSGGTADVTTVTSGGTQQVDAGGFASGTVVSGGGSDTVFGSDTVAMVSSGGILTVSSGGAAYGTTINSGGLEDVFSSGVDSGATVNDGGTLNVSAGGTASGTTVDSGGTEYVFAGGTAEQVTVSAGGVLTVFGTVLGDGSQILSGGVETVSSGGVVSGVPGSSGTAVAGGTLDVLSGGSASNLAVFGGGTLNVSGGSATFFGITGATVNVLSGGTAAHLLVFSSGTLNVLSGGSAAFADMSGGTLNVLSGGTAAHLQVSGGATVNVLGTITSSVSVYSGGIENVSSGGVATGVPHSGTAVSGGTLNVLSGGALDHSTDFAGGTTEVFAGGTAHNLTVSSGGTLNVLGTLTGNITVSGGGILTVSSGGAASGVTVSSGGNEYVYGADAGATVNDGGHQYVLAGGIATGTAVNDPGIQIVSAGGTAIGATLSGGEQDVYGTAIATTVDSGGLQIVENGGIASGTTVNRGGTEYISSDGTAQDVTFGGTFATLDLGSPSGLTGTISNWQVGDTIDFVNTSVTSANISGSTLTITTSGGQSFAYQLAGQQTNDADLQSDGAGGTDVILDIEPVPTLSVALTGNAVEGSTLTAMPTLGSDSDNSAADDAYQWERNGTSINGVIGATYVVGEQDEGAQISVLASFTDDTGQSVSATSTATAAITDAAPTVTIPLISGTAQEGQTLTASASAGQSDNAVSFAWYSSADGYTNPIGTGATYTVREADEGSSIEVKATATNDNGATTSAASAPTASVIDLALVPTVMIAPASGTNGLPLQGARAFDRFVGFGDSGIDSGYYFTHPISNKPGLQQQYALSAAAGGGIPTTLGAQMNSQLLAADYGLTAIPFGKPGGTNYAVGGAPVIGSDPFTPSVLTQIQSYLSDVNNIADPNTLYLIHAGGGDASFSPDQSPQGQINFMLAEAQALANALAQIHADGGRNFVIDATAGPLGTTYDNALWSDLATLGVNFLVVNEPVFDFSITPGSAIAQQYGITNFTQPPAGPFTASNPYDPANGGADINPIPSKIKRSWAYYATATQPNAQTYLWADNEHLAAAGQQALADFTYRSIQNAAPIPGETLTATTSLLGSAPNSITSTTYQWESSTDGGTNWTPIIGATHKNYTVQESEEGSQLRVHSFVTNDTGQTFDAYSSATPTVLDNLPTVTTPVITGTAQEGQMLTASASSGQSDNPVTYAWYSSADGYTNPIGAGATYVVQEGAEGSTIEVKATATNGDGATVSTTSTSTAAVLDAAPTVTIPTITGTAQEGQTLTASATAGQTDNAVSYAWYSSADGYTNPIGTGSTYQAKEGDEGSTIEVKATVTNDNGVTVSATSTATAAVLDAPPTVTIPIITGTAQEGQTLTASATAGQTDNAVSYAWYSSADNYTNPIGTGSTYQVKEGDEGSIIEVKATATNGDGATVTSAAILSPVTVNFDTLDAYDAPNGQIGGPALDTYLAGYGITLTASGPSAAVEAADDRKIYGGGVVGATSGHVVIGEQGGFPINYTISFATPLSTFAFDRVTEYAGPSGTSYPQWSAMAYDASGTALSSVGEGPSAVLSGSVPAAHYTLTGPHIAKVTFSGNDLGFAAFANVLTDSWALTPEASATGPVLDAASTVTTPTITGAAQEGQMLTASASSGQSDNPVTYAWYSSADGFTNPIGYGATYQVNEGDEGRQIKVVATATNDNGVTASATSAATGSVTDPPPTLSVTISGSPQDGQTLMAVATANSADAVIRYQWQVLNGATWANITGATKSTYLVAEANEKHQLRVIATSSDPDGGGATATSAATAAVTDVPTSLSVTVSGTAQQGQVLTATANATSDGDGGKTAYQWQELVGSTWAAVSGATKRTYTVGEAVEGLRIRVLATFTDDTGQSVSATSAPTAPVIDVTPTLTVTVTGTAKEGQTLSAHPVTTGDADGGTTSYQWQSLVGGIWTNITGATALTYKVTEQDEGPQLRVAAMFTDDTGQIAAATSAATAAVIDIKPTLSVTVSGTAQEGQTLTATAAANDSDAVVAFQWQQLIGSTWTDIAGGTTSTYVVSETNEGHRLRAVATSTDSDGSGTSANSAATAPVVDPAPTLTIGNLSLFVAAGGSVPLPVSVASFDSDDKVSVTIAGLPAFETITDALDKKTFAGASVTLTAAEVNSGLTLHSTYGGSGQPIDTLTLTAANTAGESSTSAAQTITVTDPPSTQTILGGLEDRKDVLWVDPDAPSGGPDLGFDAPDIRGQLLASYMRSELTAAEVNRGLTLHSTYSGSGQPIDRLALTAANTTSGETSTSAAQTITVTDPPSAQTILGGLQDRNDVLWGGPDIPSGGSDFGLEAAKTVELLVSHMASAFASSGYSGHGALMAYGTDAFGREMPSLVRSPTAHSPG